MRSEPKLAENYFYWTCRIPAFVTALLFLLIHLETANASYLTIPSDVDWNVFRSPHFSVLFRKGHDSLGERIAIAAEKAWTELAPNFPELPRTIWIVAGDFRDTLNGYSLDLPYPHIVLYLAPPEPSGALASLDQWIDHLVLHELVHSLHLYPASGVYAPLRFLFGSVVLPVGLLPSHFHEGIAVLYETEYSKKGRGRSAQFSMWRRMAVAEGKWNERDFLPADQRDGTSTIHPYGSSPYFFGWLFYDELFREKKEVGLKALTDGYARNLPYLFVSSPLQNIYGQDYGDVWKRIYERGEGVARAEIKKVEQHAATIDFITNERSQKSNLVDGEDWMAYQDWSPPKGHTLVLRTTSQAMLEKEFPDGIGDSMCATLHNGQRGLLLTLPDNANRHLTLDLNWQSEDFSRSPIKVLLDEKPIQHVQRLACAKNRFATYEEIAGKGVLRRYRWESKPETLSEWGLPPGTWITSISEGETLYFFLRSGTESELYRWSGTAPEKIAILPGHAYGLSRVDRELVFIGDFDGREEIWALNPRDGTPEIAKKFCLLSGTNSFIARNGEIDALVYRHGGYDLARLLKESPPRTLRLYEQGPRSSRRLSQVGDPQPKREVTGKVTDYSPMETLLPRAWVPNLYVVPYGLQVGAWILGFDAGQRHTYEVFGGYDTRGLPFVQVDYEYQFGRYYHVGVRPHFSPSYLIAFGDFFKRWGAQFKWGASWPFLSQFDVSVLYGRTEQSALGPSRQSIGFQMDVSHSWNVHKRPLSISPVSGTLVSASYAHYFRALGSDDDYFTVTASLQQNLEMPWWREHVLNTTIRAGYTEGAPLYNSYFEGGGDLLFYQARGLFLTRGFYPGTFAGKRMLGFNFEYRFPVAWVDRGAGLLPFKLRALHAALVGDAITYDRGQLHPLDTVPARGDFFQTFYSSLGIELKSNWMLSYYMPAQIQLGFYHGFGTYGQPLYVTMGFQASL